ncbi:MAG: phosphatidylglycerol lysyltransferase domain-containing protein [Nitrospiraceae bacterium]
MIVMTPQTPLPRVTSPRPLDMAPLLPQALSSRACLVCEICCRFPDAESPLRPYFTADEILCAQALGIAADRFPDPAGSRILVQPHPQGEGYICPAFNLASNGCSIYEARPLDCRLYPLALMWNETKTTCELGWDLKCPAMPSSAATQAVHDVGGPDSPFAQIPIEERLSGPRAVAYRDEAMHVLEREPVLDLIARHADLVTAFQDEVVEARPLPMVTARLTHQRRSVGATTGVESPDHSGKHDTITAADRTAFERAAVASPLPPQERPSAWAFATHFLWQDLLPLQHRNVAGRYLLLANSPDGMFLPVPPLGGDCTQAVVAAAFAALHESSPARGVVNPAARIESVPMAWARQWERWGYRVVPKESEFVYDTAALAGLHGDRFKSQRGACNRLTREHRVSVEPYRLAGADECARVFREWREHKRVQEHGDWPRLLLEDAEVFHQRLLRDAADLDLMGLVLLVDDRICGYTFGTALGADVFCVLAEVTDRRLAGAAEYLFRATALWAGRAGFPVINTMDASGLPGLSQSKQSYGPTALVPLATAYDRVCAVDTTR